MKIQSFRPGTGDTVAFEFTVVKAETKGRQIVDAETATTHDFLSGVQCELLVDGQAEQVGHFVNLAKKEAEFDTVQPLSAGKWAGQYPFHRNYPKLVEVAGQASFTDDELVGCRGVLLVSKSTGKITDFRGLDTDGHTGAVSMPGFRIGG